MTIDASDVGEWRHGLHPNGPGAVIGQMTQDKLAIGDALRLEMTNFGSVGVVHVQVYIASESGALALWTSCPPSLLPERMAQIEGLEAHVSVDRGAHNPASDVRHEEVPA